MMGLTASKDTRNGWVFDTSFLVYQNEDCSRCCQGVGLSPWSHKSCHLQRFQDFQHSSRPGYTFSFSCFLLHPLLCSEWYILPWNSKMVCFLVMFKPKQDYNVKLSDFGLAKGGPEGDNSHVSTRVMGTYGYTAPEYIKTGHLSMWSDVYSYGVVLLELITGRKSLDSSRPGREKLLTDWALPLLKEKKKVIGVTDPRLAGDYPVRSLQRAALLAYHCLSLNPKARPLMRDVVASLGPLQVAEDFYWETVTTVS